MKITTRILVGFGVLIIVLAVLAIYQGLTIRRLQTINRNLSQTDFRFALGCLDLMQDREHVEEFLRKRFAQPGSDYSNQLRGAQEDFEAGLADIQGSARTPEEQAEVKRLVQFWRSFTADLNREPSRTDPPGEFPAILEEHLDRLRAQTLTVYQAGLHTFAADAERSRRTGSEAEFISWSATAVAIVLSTLAAFLILRSISIPLKHLIDGTNAIASGKYFYRLDTSRKDELSQLARDFNFLTQRMAELDDMKRAFVSHVSHELKAPMASMRETVQLLLEQIPGPLTEKQKRLLELNQQSGSRLSSMIANLLDLSKIEAGVMEYDLQSNDLIPLVQTAIAGLEAQAREKNISITADLRQGPLLVECDKDRMVQVIGNVLSNSVKFSPVSRVVEVRAWVTPEVPAQMPESWRLNLADAPAGTKFALLSISDSGPGVQDVQKDRIFEKFVQVRQGKKMPGQGLGLGLAICRTIIEAHGGAIWLEDNPAGGSVFFILLRPGRSAEAIRACQ